jgi:MFS family permease
VLLANSLYHLTNDGAVTVLAGQIVVLQSVAAFGGLRPSEVGLLGGTALVVTALFQFVFGIMSDRRDPSRFLPIGIAILGVGSLLVTQAWSFWTLLAFIALSRIGASFYHPVGIAWIGREFGGPALDRSMGFQSAFGDGGVILGMASGAVLAVAAGWQSPFALWGGLNLLAVAIGLTLVRGRSSPPPPGQGFTRNYVGILRDVRLWLLPLAVGGAVFNIFSFFGPLLLYEKFGVPKDLAGVAVALWIFAGSVAAFFFGRVSRRFGRYRALLASYAAMTVAGLIGALVDNVWVVLAVFWSLGSALFLTYPALFSFVAESSRRQLQGAAFGLIFAFQLLGGAFGLFVAGALGDAFGAAGGLESSVPFSLAAALALFGFVLLVMVREQVATDRKGVRSSVPPL